MVKDTHEVLGTKRNRKVCHAYIESLLAHDSQL
jgi:hypothetical protein